MSQQYQPVTRLPDHTMPKMIKDVSAGQAVVVPRGQWVRYSTPSPDGAEYIAVCSPAFSPQTVHRDAH